MTFASCVLYQNGRRFDTKWKAFRYKTGGVSIQNARGLSFHMTTRHTETKIPLGGEREYIKRRRNGFLCQAEGVSTLYRFASRATASQALCDIPKCRRICQKEYADDTSREVSLSQPTNSLPSQNWRCSGHGACRAYRTS